MEAVISLQYRQIDSELQAAAGERAYSEITAIIAAETNYRELRTDFAEDAAYNGTPVSSRQMVQLASAMTDALKGVDSEFEARQPSGPKRRRRSTNGRCNRRDLRKGTAGSYARTVRMFPSVPGRQTMVITQFEAALRIRPDRKDARQMLDR